MFFYGTMTFHNKKNILYKEITYHSDIKYHRLIKTGTWHHMLTNRMTDFLFPKIRIFLGNGLPSYLFYLCYKKAGKCILVIIIDQI